MNYPFENDTERIEKRIAEKSVFSEKNRTFLIRVIILIAAFLLSFSGICAMQRLVRSRSPM